jgi:hypothetical protein
LLFLSFSLLQWLWLLARALKKPPPKPLKALKPLLMQLLKVQKLLPTLLPPLATLLKLQPAKPLLLLPTLLQLVKKLLPLLATQLLLLAMPLRLLATLQKKLPSNSFLASS